MIAIASSLLACAGGREARAAGALNPVYLSDDAAFAILPPDRMDGVLDQVQRIEGRHGEDAFGFTTYVKADETGILMSALNDFGTEIGFLCYDAAGLEFSGALSEAAFPVEYLLADFQLTYYQERALRTALAEIGFELSLEPLADGERRVLSSGGRRVVEIEKAPGIVHFRNILRGYSYEIRTE